MTFITSLSLITNTTVIAEDKTIDDYLPSYQRDLCNVYGEEYGISEEILEAILFCESSFKMSAKNNTCYGIAQINGSVWGYDHDTEEKQVVKMCEILEMHLEEIPDMAYSLDKYNGNSKALYNYENGIISDYADNVFTVAYELEELHGKHEYLKGEEEWF